MEHLPRKWDELFRVGPAFRASFLMVAAACSGLPTSSPDGGSPLLDAGLTVDAGPPDSGLTVDAGPPDAGLVADAGAPDAGLLTLTEYPRLGAMTDDVGVPGGPALILMGGGTDVDQAFIWAQRRIAGDGGAGGDVVVLRASGADGYTAYLLGLAPFHSVQTLKLTPPSTSADLARAADLVSHAELVWFAGGDQAMYAPWKGTPLMNAVQQVYARGGVVGGTSAGLAILGEHVFDAIAAGNTSITTSLAVADPMSAAVSFTPSVLSFPQLRGVLTDTHFQTRDRMGRLIAFASRRHAEGAVTGRPEVLGLGVDEGSALLVDGAGVAELVLQQAGVGGAWAVRVGPAVRIVAGQSLQSSIVLVTRLVTGVHTFDFNTWCGTGPRYHLTVDGTRTPFTLPADAYGATDESLPCPP
jgi:beta-aspartyl-peptidase (threonine type)